MTLSVLIVDDERLARTNLSVMLAGFDGFDVIGEAASSVEAQSMIAELEPDVVLLDISLGDGSGLELLRLLPGVCIPHVIFVTAHDRYAVEAFELNALDYLLKPVNEARLQAALDRVEDRIQRDDIYSHRDRIVEMLGMEGPGGKRLTNIVIRQGLKRYAVELDNVDYITGAGNYVRLHEGARGHLYRSSMNELECVLPPDQFARIHRSTIVKVSSVRQVESLSGGASSVILKDGTVLRLSRRNKTRLATLLRAEEKGGDLA